MKTVLVSALCLVSGCWFASGSARDRFSESAAELDARTGGERGAVARALWAAAPIGARPGGLLEVSDKSREIARRLDRSGYYSRMSRAYKGYPHLRSKQSRQVEARVASAGINTANRRRYRPRVQEIARGHGLDPVLLDAIIVVESAYEPGAVSPKGAMGLMQLMPATAARFRIEDPFDPVENLRGGARYLQWLLDRFDGDLKLALAAYNAGEAAVENYSNRIPPFPETRAYVARVLELYQVEPAAKGQFKPAAKAR